MKRKRHDREDKTPQIVEVLVGHKVRLKDGTLVEILDWREVAIADLPLDTVIAPIEPNPLLPPESGK